MHSEASIKAGSAKLDRAHIVLIISIWHIPAPSEKFAASGEPIELEQVL